MPNPVKRASRALKTYPVSLQQAAVALWGDNFWGREKINPEPQLKPATVRSRSSA